MYSRLPNKRTGYVYQFLNFFPEGMLLFEGVCLLNLKIFGYKIDIYRTRTINRRGFNSKIII